MKILQLGKFYPVRGGVEKVMFDLMSELSKRGIECDMMCAESSGPGNVRMLDSSAHVLSFRTWTKVASTSIAPSMINNLRSVAANYDLIHVHHPDPMAALALRCSGYKGPVVLHWHSDIIKGKSLLRFYEPLQEWLLERADVIVGTSPVILENSPYLAGYREKSVCIPIGIAGMAENPDGAARIRERFGRRRIVFSLGRLVPYKGYDKLLNASCILPDDYVVLIGGDGKLRKKLERQRDDSGLGNKVFFLGHIPDEQLSAYYTACDVFCLPSVMKTEAFGIVQIEAMSLGKPVVATKIPCSGTSWVNQHGVSGINVTPGNPKELADAISLICQSSENYSRLSNGARNRFESEFTLSLMAERHISLYKSMCN